MNDKKNQTVQKIHKDQIFWKTLNKKKIHFTLCISKLFLSNMIFLFNRTHLHWFHFMKPHFQFVIFSESRNSFIQICYKCTFFGSLTILKVKKNLKIQSDLLFQSIIFFNKHIIFISLTTNLYISSKLLTMGLLNYYKAKFLSSFYK